MEILFTTVFHCNVFVNLVCIIIFLFKGIIYWNIFLQFWFVNKLFSKNSDMVDNNGAFSSSISNKNSF